MGDLSESLVASVLNKTMTVFGEGEERMEAQSEKPLMRLLQEFRFEKMNQGVQSGVENNSQLPSVL